MALLAPQRSLPHLCPLPPSRVPLPLVLAVVCACSAPALAREDPPALQALVDAVVRLSDHGALTPEMFQLDSRTLGEAVVQRLHHQVERPLMKANQPDTPFDWQHEDLEVRVHCAEEDILSILQGG